MTGDTSHEEPRDEEERAPQRTEQVRIVGAERAGDVVGNSGNTPGSSEPLPGFADSATSGDSGSWGSGTGPAAGADDEWGPEDWAAPAEPQLPHWTEAPTGEIPAVLSRGDETEETDPWASLPEPTWREERHDWEQEEAIAPSLLGAPDEPVLLSPRDEEERQPWAFELDSPTARRPALDEDADFSDLEDLGTGALFGASARDEASARLDEGAEDHDVEDVDLAGFGTAGAGGGPGSVTAPPAGRHVPADGDLSEETGERTRMLRLPAAAHAARGIEEKTGDASGAPRRGLLSVPTWARLGRRHGEHADAAAVVEDAAVEAAASSGETDARRAEAPSPVAPVARHGTRRVSDAPHAGDDGLSKRTGRNIPAAIVSGLVIGGAALVAFHFGTVPSMVVVTIVVAAAALEVYAAFRRDYRPAVLLGLAAVVGLLIGSYDRPFVALPAVVVLLVAATFVWHLVGADRRADPVRSTAATLLGFAWVGVFGSFAALLLAPSLFPHRTGIAYLLGALIAAVAYDVGALVAGASIGRHPLHTVSPGKTWEGVIGGSVAAIVFALAIVHLIHPWTLAEAAVLGVVVAIVSPIGDLCESLVKRHLGLKDMGRILPGHGGLLDRVDGLLFVLPATYYILRAFGHG